MIPQLRYARVNVPAFSLRLRKQHVNILECAHRGTDHSRFVHSCAPLPLSPVSKHNACNPRSNISSTVSGFKRRQGSFERSLLVWQHHVKRWIGTISQRDSDKQNLEVATFEKKWSTSTVEIPVGGKGIVLLEITSFRHKNEDSTTEAITNDILVYLPPGPPLDAGRSGTEGLPVDDGSLEYRSLLESVSLSEAGERQIQTRSALTVIKINYRLSPLTNHDSDPEDCRFPSPIHDVSVAFDWILANQHQLNNTTGDYSQVQTGVEESELLEPRISVYGSRIGGSLALMLALTQPNELHTVAVEDPIVDWVCLDEIATLAWSMPASSNRRSKAELEETRTQTQKAAVSLIESRTQLFRNPSGFFDPFASPLMFLRAPGRDTPLWRTANPEIEQLDDVNNRKIVEAMKRDGGVEVSEAVMYEVINERGYGPYDDDWHTADLNPESEGATAGVTTPSVSDDGVGNNDLATGLEALSINDRVQQQAQQHETDLSQPRVHAQASPSPAQENLDHQITTSTPPTSSSDLQQNNSISTRRRKVLRRWPPIGRPEDVDLPWTRIYTTPPDSAPRPQILNREPVDLAYILHSQAKEMADVMRRACFWGREKWLAEERVVLENIQPGSDNGTKGAIAKAVEWFREMRVVEK